MNSRYYWLRPTGLLYESNYAAPRIVIAESVYAKKTIADYVEECAAYALCALKCKACLNCVAFQSFENSFHGKCKWNCREGIICKSFSCKDFTPARKYRHIKTKKYRKQR